MPQCRSFIYFFYSVSLDGKAASALILRRDGGDANEVIVSHDWFTPPDSPSINWLPLAQVFTHCLHLPEQWRLWDVDVAAPGRQENRERDLCHFVSIWKAFRLNLQVVGGKTWKHAKSWTPVNSLTSLRGCDCTATLAADGLQKNDCPQSTQS